MKELRIGDEPVVERLRRDRVGMTDEVLAAIVDKIAYYSELPHDVVVDDVRRIVDENIRVVAEVLGEGVQPDRARLATIADSALLRAEEGVPLEMVADAYVVGVLTAWRRSTRYARPGEVDALLAVTETVLEYLRTVLPVVTSAYVEELRMSAAAEEHGRQDLMTALVEGLEPEEAARRSGVEVGGSYLVVGLRVPGGPDASDHDVATRVSGRRLLRRVRAEVRRELSDLALTRLDTSGGILLLPRPADADDLAVTRHLGERLGVAADRPVVLTHTRADVAGLPRAVRTVRTLLDVVERSGRPPGVYGLAELALDVQLHQSTPATAQLASLLAPLAARPDLRATLEAHVATGLQRRATAAALNLHPNTVDYRLRRVAELTGLDVTDPGALPTVVAALAAHRVENG